MQYKEIIRILNNIEDNVPISKIEYKNLKIWPIIRLEMWKILYSRFKNSGEEPAKKKNLIEKIVEKVNIYVGFILYKLNPNKYKETDVVFLIARLERTIQVENKYFSRFSNSLQEILKEVGVDSVTLDLSSKKKPVWGNTYFIDREKIFSLKQKVEIQNWEKLEKYLENNFPNIKLNKDFIINNIEATLEYEKIFERILKKINPKVCFLECYYHPTGWGYIRACRKLNIKTVEVQHGEQHGLYRAWNNIPAGGYDIMPHLWWCWGEESAREINKWSEAVYPEHQAFVGGNPWISRFVSNTNKDTGDKKRSSKNILIALPNKDFPIQYILEAVRGSPANWHWQVRLHPMRIKDPIIKEKTLKEFAWTGNSNIEVEKSSSMPLFDILLNTDFLITPWSTVAYEALVFEVHPIITDTESIDVFGAYAKNGLFSFANTSEKILEILRKDKSEFNFKEEIPYIETDRVKMKTILKDLVK
ncbi:MAG: hypothetical protein A3I19_01885 [Candidatus Zambryskibacteria bacterium RIFCSPLOWO2_02_FULL_38_13]|nr:MAG: hypothetical protein A3I19_01885 [Candidatus Zambryskibacteria bacterium RIFCSPLOWO2_02_FULL_38_13]